MDSIKIQHKANKLAMAEEGKMRRDFNRKTQPSTVKRVLKFDNIDTPVKMQDVPK